MMPGAVREELRELDALGDDEGDACALCADIQYLRHVAQPDAPRPPRGECTACGRTIPVVTVAPRGLC
jgi:hypothetical protein